MKLETIRDYAPDVKQAQSDLDRLYGFSIQSEDQARAFENAYSEAKHRQKVYEAERKVIEGPVKEYLSNLKTALERPEKAYKILAERLKSLLSKWYAEKESEKAALAASTSEALASGEMDKAASIALVASGVDSGGLNSTQGVSTCTRRFLVVTDYVACLEGIAAHVKAGYKMNAHLIEEIGVQARKLEREGVVLPGTAVEEELQIRAKKR